MGLLRSLTLVGLAALLSGACAGDDDDDDEATAGYGTCDLRSKSGTCIEATGSPRSISDQKAGCLNAGGVWSTDPCPTTDESIGCCEYTLGNQFRECFYEHDRSVDPVEYCEDFLDGGRWIAAEP